MSRTKIPRKKIQPLLKDIEAEGLTVLDVHVSGSGHLCFVASDGTKTRKLFTSSSPSDPRAYKNFRKKIRKIFRDQP